MALASTARMYIKNVGKSFLYSTADVLKDNTPYLNSLFKDSKDTVTEMYQSIKDFSSGKGAEIKSMGKEALDNLFKNLKDDIKTGNWYNKERDDVLNSEMMKMMGFDIEGLDDFSFDDESFDFGSDTDDITDGDELIVKQNAKNTAATIMAVDKVGAKVTEGVNRGTAASADYIVKSNKAMNTAMFKLNSKGFATITEAIATLNKNTIDMNEAITRPLTTFMQNGTLFFTKTSESLDKLVKITEQILERTPAINSSGSYGSKASKSISDFASGGFSLGSYKDFVKGNIKENTDMIMSIASMFGGAKSLKMTKGISPLRMPLNALVKAMMPTMLMTSLKAFDEGLKAFIPSMIAKEMATDRGGGFLSYILKGLFIPERAKIKDKLNTGAYNRGPIPFDGETKKAITYVIPQYLSNILSAITGGKQQLYDYSSGRFVGQSELESMKNQREQRYIDQAGGRLKSDALDRARKNKNIDQARVTKELEAYFREAFMSGEGFTDINKVGVYSRSNKANNRYAKILSADSLRILRELVRTGKYNDFIYNNMTSRDDLNKMVAEISKNGLNPELALHDNSSALRGKTGSFVGGVDQYNNGVLDYLRGIYVNTLGGTGGSGGTVKLPSGLDLPSLSKANVNSSSTAIKLPKDKESVDSNNYEQVKKWNESIDRKIKTLAGKLDSLKRKKKNNPDDSSIDDEIEKIESKVKDNTDEYIMSSNEAEVRAKVILEGKKYSSVIETKLQDTEKKVKGFMSKFIPDAVLDYMNKPIEAVSKLLNTLTRSMTNFLWGDGSKDGIFDQVRKNITEAIKKNKTISKFLDDVFGEEDPKTHKRTGFWKETKASLKEYWNWMKAGYREKWDATGSGAAKYVNAPAANGRRITKTGMIAVSEGEMVIPAEFNPFYRKSINKKEQYRKEYKAIDNFYGNYANGGIPIIDVTGGRAKRLFDGRDILAHHQGILNNLSRENGNTDRMTINGVTYYKNNGKWSKNEEGSIGSMLSKGFKDAGDILKNAVSSGVDKISGGKDGKQKLESMLGKFGDDFKVARGRVGAGALIGTGIGGVLGSPLLGAMVGSVAGFVSKSESAQKFLFGEYDEEKGEYKGGALPKSVSNLLTKNAPDMLRGGTVGLVAGGALIGGPIGMVGGLLAGSAIGFARKSTKIQEFLFGKEEDGKLVKKGLFDKNKFQKALPKAIIGAGLGALIGPSSGLLINMMLGAGLGFLSENEKIHAFLFGSEKDGKKTKGLLNNLADKLFGGVNDLFHNTTEHIKVTLTHLGKNILTKVGNIKSWFQQRSARRKALKNVEQTPLRKILNGVGKVGKGLGIGLGGAAALPFLAPFLPAIGLGGAAIFGPKALAKMQKTRHLRKGENVYDSTLGRNLTAAERMAYRDEKKIVGADGGKWDEFDRSIGTMSAKNLQNLSDILANSDTNNRELNQNINSQLTNFYNAADSTIDSAQLNHIAKYIKTGDVTGLAKFAEDNGLSGDLIAKATESASAINKQKGAIAKRSKQLKNMYGIRSDKDLTKAQELIKNELNLKDKDDKAQETRESIEDKIEKVRADIEVIAKEGIFIRKKSKEELAEDKAQKNLEKSRKHIKTGKFRYVDADSLEIMKNNGEITDEQYNAAKSYIESHPKKDKKSIATGIVQAGSAALDGIDSGIKGIGKGASAVANTLGNVGLDIADDTNTMLGRAGYIGNYVKNLALNKFDSIKAGISNIRENGIGNSIKAGVEKVKESASRVIYNAEGNPIKLIYDKAKKMFVPNRRDKDTDNQLSDANATEKATIKLPAIMSKVSSGIKNLSDGLIGKVKDKGGSIFDKLKDIGKKVLITGGIIGGISLVPNLLPMLGKGLKWFLTDGIDFITNKLIPVLGALGNFLVDKGYNLVLNTFGSQTTEAKNIDTNISDKKYDSTTIADEQISESTTYTSGTIKSNKTMAALAAGGVAGGKVLGPGGAILAGGLTAGIAHKAAYSTTVLDKTSFKNPSEMDTTQIVAKLPYYDSNDKVTRELYVYNTKYGPDNYYAIASGSTIFPNHSQVADKSFILFVRKAPGLVGLGKSLALDGVIIPTEYYTKFINSYTSDEKFKKIVKKIRNKSSYLNVDLTVGFDLMPVYMYDGLLEILHYFGDHSYDNAFTKDQQLSGKGSGLSKIKNKRYSPDSFVSQHNSVYATNSYGGSTVGNNGCAPAVATMISSLYGKNLSMNDAIRLGKEYTNKNGTNIGYFRKVLGQQGIHTKSSDIEGTIANLLKGNPAILLGQDSSNNSKSKSPFGPKNHYILANGFDKDGKLVVSDPEMHDTTSYDPEILKSTISSLTTNLYGGESGIATNSNAYNNLIGSNSVNTAASDIKSIKTNNIILAKKGSKSDGMLEQLVSAILNLLTRMVDLNVRDSANLETIKLNSNELKSITTLLEKYNAYTAAKASNASGSNQEIDSSFADVVNQMAQLVKG